MPNLMQSTCGKVLKVSEHSTFVNFVEVLDNRIPDRLASRC